MALYQEVNSEEEFRKYVQARNKDTDINAKNEAVLASELLPDGVEEEIADNRDRTQSKLKQIIANTSDDSKVKTEFRENLKDQLQVIIEVLLAISADEKDKNLEKAASALETVVRYDNLEDDDDDDEAEDDEKSVRNNIKIAYQMIDFSQAERERKLNEAKKDNKPTSELSENKKTLLITKELLQDAIKSLSKSETRSFEDGVKQAEESDNSAHSSLMKEIKGKQKEEADRRTVLEINKGNLKQVVRIESKYLEDPNWFEISLKKKNIDEDVLNRTIQLRDKFSNVIKERKKFLKIDRPQNHPFYTVREGLTKIITALRGYIPATTEITKSKHLKIIEDMAPNVRKELLRITERYAVGNDNNDFSGEGSKGGVLFGNLIKKSVLKRRGIKKAKENTGFLKLLVGKGGKGPIKDAIEKHINHTIQLRSLNDKWYVMGDLIFDKTAMKAYKLKVKRLKDMDNPTAKFIYNKTIPKELYELLSRRTDKNTQYDLRSLRMYDDLLQKAGIDIRRSKSHKIKQVLESRRAIDRKLLQTKLRDLKDNIVDKKEPSGEGIKFYKNKDELRKRQQLIRGLISSGNNSKELVEELSEILTKLHE